MKHILVTGGAGYLGSTMVPELLKKGYKVTVIDNFMFKQNSLANVCSNPNFEIIRGDIRQKDNERLHEKCRCNYSIGSFSWCAVMQ